MRRALPVADPLDPPDYQRTHVGGVIGCVWVSSDPSDRCIAGTMLFGAHVSFARVPGIEDAKARADTDSGCPQPCQCPPWSAVSSPE